MGRVRNRKGGDGTTVITLTEADRIELPAPQYAGRDVVLLMSNGTHVVDSLDDQLGEPCTYGVHSPAYLLPEIKIAEPEKPPGMVQGIYDGERVWVYRFVGDSVCMIFPSGYHATKYVGGVEIINNPHNDPTLEAAIRAAQEGNE